MDMHHQHCCCNPILVGVGFSTSFAFLKKGLYVSSFPMLPGSVCPPTCHSALHVQQGGVQGEVGDLHPDQSPRCPLHAQGGDKGGSSGLLSFVSILSQFWR